MKPSTAFIVAAVCLLGAVVLLRNHQPGSIILRDDQPGGMSSQSVVPQSVVPLAVSECRSLWNKKNQAWYDAESLARIIEPLMTDMYKSGPSGPVHKVWVDPFEPTWSCDRRERVGPVYADGGKWMCNADLVRPEKGQRNCLMYDQVSFMHHGGFV